MTVYIEVQTPECMVCGIYHLLTVPRDGYEAWNNGMFIQRALPLLTADEREMLMTGTCPECWDSMFLEEGYDVPDYPDEYYDCF